MTSPNIAAKDEPEIGTLGRRKTSFGGDVLKLVSGTSFAQLLTILASPILTRLYGPDSFGVLALFTSVTSVLIVIASLRYELAIMLPENDRDAANLLGVSLGFALIISIITVPIALWGNGLLHWINGSALAPYLLLIPPAVFAGGAFQALNSWNTRTKHFGRLSIARMSQSVFTVTAQIASGFTNYVSGGTLIAASVGGSALAATALGAQVLHDERRLFREAIKWDRMLYEIKRYRKFPLVDIWGALLNTISWQLPVLMFAVYFSQAVVGYYALAFRLIYMPMSLIGVALSQVYFQRASESKSDISKLTEISETVFQRLVALCLLPALVLAVIGSDAFAVVFGAQWTEAGQYAQILSIWMFFWFISSPLSTVFIAQERQELALLIHVMILATRIASLVIGGRSGNVFTSLWLFSLSGAAVYGGMAFWSLALSGVRAVTTIQILVRNLLFAMPFVGTLVALKIMGIGSLGLTCISVALILVYYYLVVWRQNLLDISSIKRSLHASKE